MGHLTCSTPDIISMGAIMIQKLNEESLNHSSAERQNYKVSSATLQAQEAQPEAVEEHTTTSEKPQKIGLAARLFGSILRPVVIVILIVQVFKGLRRDGFMRGVGTRKWLKRTYAKVVSALRKGMLDSFDRCIDIDETAKKQVKRQFKAVLLDTIHTGLWFAKFVIPLFFVDRLIMLVVALFALYFAPQITPFVLTNSGPVLHHTNTTVLFVMYIGLLCILYLFPVEWNEFLRKRKSTPPRNWNEKWCRTLLCFCPCLLVLFRLGFLTISNPAVAAYVVALCIAGTGLLFAEPFAFRVTGLPFRVLLYFNRHKYPVVGLTAFFLLTMLENIKKGERSWGKPAFSADLMQNLEFVAHDIENRLPLQLKSRDEQTDTWFQVKCGRVANYIRSLKRWVLVPKPDTRAHFEKAVQSLFVNIVSMNWDGLVEVEETNAAAIKRWYHKVFSALSQIGVALLLPLSLYIFHRMYPTVAIPPTITALVLGFPVVQLLTLLDPNLNAKITALKDITQVAFPPNKSNKDR